MRDLVRDEPGCGRVAKPSLGRRVAVLIRAAGPKVTPQDMASHMRHVGDLNFSVLLKMLSSLRAHRTAAFLPVVAPASALPGCKNEVYADEPALLFALADCLHQEYRAIVDAGLYVQIDDAFLPYMHEKMVPPMTHAQYREWAQLRIDALNHALKGIPPERSRYHICWGSWNGPHAFDVPLK